MTFHSNEKQLGHLLLPEFTRKAIAAKDIQKIFRQYNIEGIQLQTNDAQSVSLWVKEINDQCADGSDNLILLYKPQVVEPEGELQGSLNKKDFCVCIQTSFC